MVNVYEVSLILELSDEEVFRLLNKGGRKDLAYRLDANYGDILDNLLEKSNKLDVA